MQIAPHCSILNYFCSMKSAISKFYLENPLKCIVAIGLLFRLVAAIFSEGYAFQDDHFLIIEVAQQWLDKAPSELLPQLGAKVPSGHSFFYPGLHYWFFKFLHALGIDNPNTKMLLVRIIHAFYSMTIVLLGYKITSLISNKKNAETVGWILAIFWIFPLLSVRNLIEYVCIPPLMLATYLILKHQNTTKFFTFIGIGFVAGIAFSFRFQTILFIGGMGLVLLLQKEFQKAIMFGLGALISIVLIQGGVDYLIWNKPFAEFIEYTNYNLHHSGEYPNGPWYNYSLLILGLFIVPLSFYLIWGNIKAFRKYLMLSLPWFIFFIFHSYFPNKQERFVLPVLPFFIILGVVGWNEYLSKSNFWSNRGKLYQSTLTWILCVNMFLLCFLTPASTKISKVRVMNYFRERGEVSHFVLETTQMWGSVLMPRYYHGVWNLPYTITQEFSASQFFDSVAVLKKPRPSHVVFAEPKDLEKRISLVKAQVKDLIFEKEIESSYLDKTMTWLNPVNVNQTYYIYRIVYK